MKKLIYIPIEIKSREFLAKLILALELACDRYTVIVGKSTEVEKMCILGPSGVYLGTSIMQQHNTVFKRIKRSGSKVIAADEEGLVYYNEEDFKKHKINEQSLENLDYFIVWGKHHEDLVRAKCPNMIGKLRRIGNIRMEILKPQYRFLYEKKVKEIQEKYGKFILINTNFGAYNHYEGENKYLEIAKNLVGEDKKDATNRADKIEHQRKVFESFVKLAKRLEQEFNDFNIIVRPHPSENVKRWEEAFKGYKVQVVREGNVLPWIISSECIVQQNCTTAIEALCMDKNVFSYLPDKDDRFDAGLPNKVSPVFEKEDDLVVSIGNVIDNADKYNDLYKTYRREKLCDYISGLDKKSNVFESYIDVFNEVTNGEMHFKRWWLLKTKYSFYNFVSLIFNKNKREQLAYISQKYPHTDYEVWEELVGLLNKMNGGKYEELNIIKLAEDTYSISGANG